MKTILDFIYHLGNLADFGIRERTVFGERLRGKTLEEVGKDMGITRERVRQIESRAIKKMEKVFK